MPTFVRRIRIAYAAYRTNGIWHVAKKIFAKFISVTGFGPYFTFTLNGHRLRIYPTLLTHNLFADRSYRTCDDGIFRKFVSGGDTVIDVGANIGSVSLLFSTLVGEKGKVLAFEPSPTFFPYLQGNIAVNGFSNIIAQNCALGAERATLYLNQGRDDDTTYRIETHSAGETHVPVPVVPLDEFTTDIERIRLLKIDVEGFECEVLAGARETLKKTQVAYVELVSKNLLALGVEPERLVRLLEQQFDLYIADGKNFKTFTFEQGVDYGTDLVCLQKNDGKLHASTVYFKPLVALSADSIQAVYEKSERYYEASEHLASVRVPRPIFWNELGIGYEWLPIGATLADSLYVGRRWSVELFTDIGKALGELHSSLGDEECGHGDFLPHNIAELDGKLVFFDFDPPMKREGIDVFHPSDRYADIAAFTVGLWLSHPFKRLDRLFANKTQYVHAFLRGYEQGFGSSIQRDRLVECVDGELVRWLAWYQRDSKRRRIHAMIKYATIRVVRWVQERIYKTFDSYYDR